jgi:hypothetical protein
VVMYGLFYECKLIFLTIEETNKKIKNPVEK